ncbi:MAG: DUF1289 domain-containing protein [Comamonadaceae bacterium]|nr:MAG: DUF1289 domain-containing protein [Comamonadaceae bacterium]
MTVSENVPSPCISVCRMNPQSGLCEGCLRSIEEIAQWGEAGDDLKRAILWRIEQRREKGAS